MWASPKSLTKKPLKARLKRKANISASPVAAPIRALLDSRRALASGEGYKFVDEVVGGAIPKEYIKPIDKGIQESANGVIAGYPLVDFQATVFDGSYHDVDSSEMAFKIAASKGLQDAVKKLLL